MAIDDVLAFMQSEQYRHMMMSMYAATTAGFVLITVVAVVFYVRSRRLRPARQDAPTVLVATAFDTVLIAVLYAGLEFVFRADTFRHETQITDSWLVITGPLMVLYFKWIIDVLIAIVALTRMVILARWLAERAKDK